MKGKQGTGSWKFLVVEQAVVCENSSGSWWHYSYNIFKIILTYFFQDNKLIEVEDFSQI